MGISTKVTYPAGVARKPWVLLNRHSGQRVSLAVGVTNFTQYTIEGTLTKLNQTKAADRTGGTDNLLPVDIENSVDGWEDGATVTLTIDTSRLKVANTGEAAATTNYTFTTAIGTAYTVDITYVKVATNNAVFSIDDADGNELDTTTITSSTTGTLTFTAVSTTSVFNMTNVDATTGDNGMISSVNYYATNSGAGAKDIFAVEAHVDETGDLSFTIEQPLEAVRISQTDGETGIVAFTVLQGD